ncbi:hypothetical protein [Noviherbaspirillum aridicola]|uniref:Pyridoxamine 5'-phosphate oxidase putative domain-containing protein n=1 Tax=Noviherbaspirillum aridicola TaxID=2849687 RepID=A0ABQ4Q3B0_9BURK|nr:hypothetical protein [Noviherbaspirillum aridicola]GIZ51663.1 hypothetical protein NCCP691_16770 [Noviherbaspirillum aridicola]
MSRFPGYHPDIPISRTPPAVSPPQPLIDAQHAAFIQGGVSMSIGACGPGRHPTLARGTGCRISADLRRVTVFVSMQQAAPVLDCVRDNGLIAAAFSQPSTHRTIQLKGRDARLVPLDEGDAALIIRYRQAFAADLATIGFRAEQVETLLGFPASEVVAIRFTLAEAYVQTPGPQAGERLQSRS